MIRLVAGCKINLGLRVLGRLKDGYHELQTIFYPLSQPADTLLIKNSDSEGIVLECDAPGLGGTGNLVCKAFDAFCRETGKHERGYHVKLLKDIPVGAGLGGGSADAACFLKWLNRDGCLDSRTLVRIGAQLGADVPFFLQCEPCMAGGIGDKLRPVRFWGAGWYIVLVCNEIFVNTGEAFSAWDNSASNILTKPISAATEIISAHTVDVENDLEMPVFDQWPQLAELKDQIGRLGAVKTAMSGSGSSIYGLFDNRTKALTACSKLAIRYPRVICEPMRNFGM